MHISVHRCNYIKVHVITLPGNHDVPGITIALSDNWSCNILLYWHYVNVFVVVTLDSSAMWADRRCYLAFFQYHPCHNDVIKWKHFPCYWPFVRGIRWTQRLVTRTFDVFFDLCLNKRLSKQSRRRWFETPSRSLWRHCNDHAYTFFRAGFANITTMKQYLPYAFINTCQQYSTYVNKGNINFDAQNTWIKEFISWPHSCNIHKGK